MARSTSPPATARAIASSASRRNSGVYRTLTDIARSAAHPPDDMEEREAARTEALAAQAAYRKRVRAAGLAIVFGVGAVLAVSAILPTTPPADRFSLFFTATLSIVGGIIWFTLVPRSAFGEARIFVAAGISQAVMIVMLGLTGDSGSIYFAYYLLPILGIVLAGSWRQ